MLGFNLSLHWTTVLNSLLIVKDPSSEIPTGDENFAPMIIVEMTGLK